MPAVLSILCMAFLLASCAAIPSEFTKQVDRSLTVADAKRAPEQFRGKAFLLGGTVQDRKDLQGMTWLRIEEHSLDTQDRPDVFSVSKGAFTVVSPAAADAAQYRPGKQVTLVGRLAGVEQVKSGGKTEPMPAFEALYLRLWKPSWSFGGDDYDSAYHDNLPSCQRVIGAGC